MYLKIGLKEGAKIMHSKEGDSTPFCCAYALFNLDTARGPIHPLPNLPDQYPGGNIDDGLRLGQGTEIKFDSAQSAETALNRICEAIKNGDSLCTIEGVVRLSVTDPRSECDVFLMD